MAITKAILLVGGEGTRLRPLTLTTPKPMLEVAGYPISAHQIAKLAAAGITEIALATSFHSEKFTNWLAEQNYPNLKISIAHEITPLGTGGAIRNAAELLALGPTEAVVVLNGDVLSGHDLDRQLAEFAATDAAASLHLVTVKDPSAFGLVPTGNGWVTAFLEKPKTAAEIVTNQINAGCYVLRAQLIEQIELGVPSSVERDVFPKLIQQGTKILGYVDDTYFLDLGTPQAFVQGSADLVQGKVSSPLVKSAEALISPLAKIDPTAVIYAGSTVMAGAQISAGAVVAGSIVYPNAKVGVNSQLFDSILGAGAEIVDALKLTQVIIAEQTRIAVEIPPGVRVWPNLELVEI